jgi:hypothetical protein
MEETVTIHAEENTSVQAHAEIRTMGEGDLLVGLRHAGAHPDNEKAIVTIAVEPDGRFVVTVMDGDGCLIDKVEVA